MRMASSTVSVVLSVTGLGVMQSLTRRGLILVGVDTNTRLTPDPAENAATDDGSDSHICVVELPNSKERNTGRLFMVTI